MADGWAKVGCVSEDIGMSLASCWPVVALGEVVDNKNSKRIPLKQSDRAAQSGEYPYYGASGIIDYVDEYLFEGPHLLIGEDGANLLSRSTPIAFMASGKFWVNNHAHVLGATEYINLRFLEYFFKTLDLEPYVTGSAQPKLNRKNLDRIPIPLPPIAEQKRIAAILDKADSVRRKRKEAIALTEELLRSAFLEMFGDPFTNPKGWEMKVLHEVLDLITYGLTVRPKYHDVGIPLVSGTQIRHGTVDLVGAPHISREDYKKLSDKSKAKCRDILFAKTGAIGHCAMLEVNQEVAVAQNIARLVFKEDEINPLFALHYLRTKFVQDLAKRQAKGNAVQDLQLGEMKKFPIPVPPIQTQEEFAKACLQIEQLIEHNSNEYDLTDILFNSLLQRAFRGEL
ncbi:restriction endonuclease subunit S [Leptolyngbya sp. CCY15150]|uniref:restriction endonuclease subunit S n=1 Tax=Leptolyngbya sp. CCY15150 TaxID=2767772 RepID=UPI00194FCDAD|nr:restriction endonuclease subunit S [Leptolyngbya sp. CCY15150]